MANIPGKPKFYHVAAGSLLARYIRFVARTAWQTREMTESFEDHEGNHPCIIGMWHGQFMLLPLIRMSDVAVDVMLARHGDAEALGQTLKHFDMQLIRGAGAGSRAKDRGGAHAFRAAVQSLRDGRTVAMTADVPGGEARRAGLGIVMVARQSGRPILPVAIATSRYISLQHLEPHDGQPALLGDGLCRRSARHRAARCRSRAARGLSAGGRGRRSTRQPISPTAAPAPTRRAPRPHAAARNVSTEPGLRLKAYRALTSLARPVAPALLRLRERRGKEDPARRPERFGQAERRTRPPGGSPGSTPPASARPTPSCR